LNKLEKIKNILEDIYYLPIFVIREQIVRGGELKFSKQKVRTQFKEENLCIMMGRSKLFTVPFWRCNLYDNVCVVKDFNIDDIPMSSILSKRILERYLKGNMVRYGDKLNINFSDTSICSCLIEEIKKNKIYDIDFNSVVNNNIYPEIKEILYCTPTNKRSYEKKYYDLQDLPNIEIEEKNRN